MLRRGVELLCSDIKAARSFAGDTKLLEEGLLNQQGDMRDWQKRWLVTDDAPEAMFIEFSGQNLSEGIRPRLHNLRTDGVEAEKSFYGIPDPQSEDTERNAKIENKSLIHWVNGNLGNSS